MGPAGWAASRDRSGTDRKNQRVRVSDRRLWERIGRLLWRRLSRQPGALRQPAAAPSPAAPARAS